MDRRELGGLLMRNAAIDFIAGAFVLAVIYVLVRPRSVAAQVVDAFTSFTAGLVGTAASI